MIFPKDVDNGTIFEAAPGTYYQYDKRSNSWIKMDGINTIFDVATPLQDGLMTSEDLNKVNGLLLPPPKTSLSNKNCSLTFDSGTFGFRSSSGHLDIETSLAMMDKDSKGFLEETKSVFKIHENTYGINFSIDLPTLISELESRGNLSYKKSIGAQGKKGATGAAGIDKLDTGPKGDDGQDGSNAPYSGQIVRDNEGLIDGDSRGIIDIMVDEVSPSENNIIITRALMGDPDLCPKFIMPKNLPSKWVVAIDETPNKRIMVDECNAVICGVQQCSPDVRRTITQAFCSTSLYYLDFSVIEQEVRSRYEQLLQELKSIKEASATTVLQALMTVFNEHKLALCCAIENCESRRENQRHRNIIDGEQIQAAQAGHSIIVDGEEVREYVDSLPGVDCPEKEDEENDAIDREEAGTEVVEPVDTCENMEVLCGAHKDEETAKTMELPAGDYEVEVNMCCGFTGFGIGKSAYEAALNDPSKVSESFNQIFKKLLPYNGVMKIKYQSGGQELTHNILNKGTFRTLTEAQAVYNGLKFNITHDGGLVKAYYDGGRFERNRLKGSTITFNSPSGPVTVPFKGGFADEGVMGLCFRNLSPSVSESTSPFRQECEQGFSEQYEFDAEESSLQVASGGLTIPTEPRAFSLDDNIYENQTGRPLIIDLPSAGTYEIEVISGSIYNSTILDADLGRVCNNDCYAVPPGVYPKGQMPRQKFPDGERIPDTYTILDINYTYQFFDGWLVTQAMYDAAIDDNVDAFHEALLASRTITSGDSIYRGLKNNSYPDDDLRVDIAKLMKSINDTTLGYDGTIAAVYNGYENENATTAVDLIQSMPSQGKFKTAADAESAYMGNKMIVSVEGLELKLFYNKKPEFGPYRQPNVIQDKGKMIVSVSCLSKEESNCGSPLISTKLDCKYRDKENNALIIDAEAGDYVLSINDCCCMTNDGYHGRVVLKYVGMGSEEVKLVSPNFGFFSDLEEANNAYGNSSFSFSHQGGQIKIWAPISCVSGLMGIELQRKECFDLALETGAGTDMTEYEKFVKGEDFDCFMTAEHVSFYESSWIGRACCGAVVDISGAKWIVIKKSIGADPTCGGGESLESDCIQKGADIGIHPAIAFPTVDGRLFLGKPTSGTQRMFRDTNLEYRIRSKIIGGDTIKSVNNPENIDSIVFPRDD